jgi:hypothetical protein
MEEEQIREYQQRRENFLTLFLALLGGTTILFCLVLVTGGFFLWVLIGLGVIAFVGGFHYLLWGKLFSDQVAGEREEMEALEDERQIVAVHKGRTPRRRV